MIQTVAQFLHELMQREAANLEAVTITHGPTIGDMYEGLSADLLARAIPAELGLQVATGFIEDGFGSLSGQIDCMLVAGVGRQIPYTDGHIWHIKDVIAVLEIKKTLYSADLTDAFIHLAAVKSIERNYIDTWYSDVPTTPDVTPALLAYSQITGRVAAPLDQFASLPAEDQIVLSTLLSERIGAIRIIFGYSGFKSEKNFRDSLYTTLVKSTGIASYGVGSFPHLIVSGEHALVKANGMPYMSLVERDRWLFYCSTKANPLLLMLEFIWTRLDQDFGIGGLWGDDLVVEVMHAFLSAHIENRDGRLEWAIGYHDGSDKQLAAVHESAAWEPTYLTDIQAVIIQVLGSGKTVDFTDRKLLDWLASEAVDPNELREDLLDTRLVAMQGAELKLITKACSLVVLPDGRFVAADDNTGRLTRWITARIANNSDYNIEAVSEEM